MKRLLQATALAFGVAIAAPTSAQTLNVMRSIDAPHFDAQRTTWGPTGEVASLVQDTLVALDWDAKTAIPNIAIPSGLVVVSGPARGAGSPPQAQTASRIVKPR